MRQWYFDMDGVLFDFEKKIDELGIRGYSKIGKWNYIQNYCPNFYQNLSPMEFGFSILDQAYNKYADEVYILSALPRHANLPDVSCHKLNSIECYIKPKYPKVKTFLVSNRDLKKNLAARGRVLIDDREDTIQEWNDANGCGLLLKNNTLSYPYNGNWYDFKL